MKKVLSASLLTALCLFVFSTQALLAQEKIELANLAPGEAVRQPNVEDPNVPNTPAQVVTTPQLLILSRRSRFMTPAFSFFLAEDLTFVSITMKVFQLPNIGMKRDMLPLFWCIVFLVLRVVLSICLHFKTPNALFVT